MRGLVRPNKAQQLGLVGRYYIDRVYYFLLIMLCSPLDQLSNVEKKCFCCITATNQDKINVYVLTHNP